MKKNKGFLERLKNIESKNEIKIFSPLILMEFSMILINIEI